MFRTAFPFLEIDRLADGELELVPPQERYVDEIVAACRHPLTQQQMPREAGTTRPQLMELIQNWPMGHQPAESSKGTVPAYHFWMRNLAAVEGHGAGGIGLRIGNSDDILLYYGHIGYHVFPHHRGHHFAERACRLLFPIARHHGLHTLWITCNPDNQASRRTCERLGMQLIDTVDVPARNPLYLRGERQKCRYRMELG